MIDAALAIPVYRSSDGELHIVMILRQPGGVHGGQVAFPGGKHDPEDETMLDTALREVREELGLLMREPTSSPSYRLWKPEPRATACSHT
jgi:8-oxo-dGTP pyrophosphatase MutT (NUDIX family)